MTVDIATIREDTPGTRNVIHLNSAGSSLMPAPVLDAVKGYENIEYVTGGYETAARRSSDINQFYTQGAKLVGARPDQMAFTDSATTAWQRALFSIPWKNGDEIITGNAEYASNYISFLRLKKWFDIEIKVAADNQWGETDPNAVRDLINPKTRLVAITHMPTINGLVNPVEEIGEALADKDVIYLVDACQSVGHCPIDVTRIKCHFLSGTGRKYLRGPRGTGFLYVSDEALEFADPISADLYSSMWDSTDTYKSRKNALRFEQFESSLANKVGLAKAMEYQNQLGIESTWERIQELGDYLRDSLGKKSGLRNVDKGKVLSGITIWDLEKASPFDVMTRLHSDKINVTAGGVVNSRLYMEANQLNDVLRVSVHYYNTKEEIDMAVDKIAEKL